MQMEVIDGIEVETWTPDEVQAALGEGRIVLIDVRTPQEFMFEHIEGALLMPMAFFAPGSLPGQESKRVVLHCGSGARSGRMAVAATRSGVSPIAHMQGGFGAWKQAGKPYIGTNMSTGAPQKVAP